MKKVDLHIGKNTLKHHTDQYARTEVRTGTDADGKECVLVPELVVRRGQEFVVTLTLNREYNAKKHDMEFIFFTGRFMALQVFSHT